MSKTTKITPNFWSVYKTMNFKRFSKNRDFFDANSGKMLSYSFADEDAVKNSAILSCMSMVLWMSPALLVALLTVIYAKVSLIAFPIGILVLVAYHFGAMYYVIRGPLIEYHEEKRKRSFFGL